MAGPGFAAAAAAFGGLGGYLHCREQVSQTCMAERSRDCFDQFHSCMASGAPLGSLPQATTANDDYGLVPAAYAGVTESLAAPLSGLPKDASDEETKAYWDLMEATELDDKIKEEDVDASVRAGIVAKFGIAATPDAAPLALVGYDAAAEVSLPADGAEVSPPSDFDEEDRYGVAPKKVQTARIDGIAKRFHKRNYPGFQKAVLKRLKEKARQAENHMTIYASSRIVAMSRGDAQTGQGDIVFVFDRTEKNKQIRNNEQMKMIRNQLFDPLMEKLRDGGYHAEVGTEDSLWHQMPNGLWEKWEDHAVMQVSWE